MTFDARIISVEALPEACLSLRFQDGSAGTVDYAPTIARGGVAAPLGDPSAFARVRISRSGRAVEWECGFDACADALWMQVHAIDITKDQTHLLQGA